MTKTNKNEKTNETMPRLISARKFSKQEGLDYGYILREIKNGNLNAELHGKRYKIDRRVAFKWSKSKQLIN